MPNEREDEIKARTQLWEALTALIWELAKLVKDKAKNA
jgi:hypothetical protein